MTVRSIAIILALALVPALPGMVGSQTTEAYEWTRNRPDAYGPVSLSETFTLGQGELAVGLRFVNVRQEGQGIGTDSVSVNQVLSAYSLAPTELVVQQGEVDILFGLTPHLTLSATGRFATKTMNQMSLDPDDANTVWIAETRATGLQDVRVAALYNLFDHGPLRAHVQGGVSVPVGQTDATDQVLDPDNPLGAPVSVQLPYEQQLGSGTFDALPGATLSIQNRTASLGLQGQAVIRMGENDRGWSLGDVYTGTIWGGYRASDHISVSMAGRFTKWGNVEGFDEDLTVADVYDSPAYNSLREGWKAEIPFGLNILMPEGRFQGHRLGVEAVFPVHQSLNWIQFREDWSVAVGWSKTLSF